MDKKEFHQFLEDDSLSLKDEDNQAFAQLLKEVEDLETPDPGQVYWNNFNSRLQSRIDTLPPKRHFLASWFGASLWATALAAVVLAVFLLKPGDGPVGLDQLTAAELQVMSMIYEDLEFYDEDTSADNWSLDLDQLEDNDIQLLIDSVESSAGMFYDLDPASFDADEFQSLWKSEG